jgi:hypothetical protein
MQSETVPETASLTARESDARALMRRLRACGREIERLTARARAGCGSQAAEHLERRIGTLRAEADQMRLELAGWDVAGSRLWTERLGQRLERLALAIATAEELSVPRVQRERVLVWPRRTPKRGHQIADDVERAVYDYLYPRPGPSAAFG